MQHARAQGAAQAIEGQYRALLEAIPDLIFRLDGEGRFLDFVMAKGQGPALRPAVFLGRTVGEVMPTDLARRMMHHIDRALQTGEAQVLEYRIPVPLPDGNPRDYEARIAASAKDEVVAIVRDITERKRAEEALRASEAKYRQVFEHVHDVFFRTDMNGVVTEVSPSAQWWGYKPEDLNGAQVTEFYVDLRARPALQKALLEQGRVVDQHVRLKAADGRALDASASFYLLRGPDGAPVGIEGIARDVSERVRAEEALRASEQRLRTLITNAPVVLFAIDREGVFTIVEGRGLSGLGLRPGENVGRSVFDVYRDVPEVIDAAQRALAGESFTLTLELAELTFHAHYGPLRDRHGRVCGGIGVGTDITERKRAEEALRASEERWRSLVQNSPDVIMNVARDGTLVLINRTLPGFPPPEQMVGASVYEFIPPQDHDTMRGALERAFQTGEADGFEIAGSGPHRTISYYACRLAPVEYDGQVASVNLIATDVTERKRAEEILRIQRDLGLALSTAVHLEDTLSLCLHAAIRASGLDSGCVYLGDTSSGAFHLAWHEGLGGEFVEKIARFKADSSHARAATTGKPLYTQHEKLTAHLRIGMDEPRRREGLRAIAAVPIQHRGEVIACLCVTSHSLDHIPPASQAALEAVASRIGSAIARGRAEEALRESEERFRRLSEATLEGVVIHDGERILDANLQVAAMVGHEVSELIGMNPLGFVAPDYRDQVRQQILSGNEESHEVEGLRKDGSTFQMEVCAKTASYKGRQVRVGLVRDISERKRAEEAAQAVREELESRVEHAMRQGNHFGLTFRELTVLLLMVAGRADKEIAFQLSISPRTASKHVENILQKMGVASRTEASVRALRAGLVGDRAGAVPSPSVPSKP
jgi:PAS domain S-box-containing protein